ncbi:MAG: galactokinase [Planctomycetaceae bacterium]|jgi:galactokinase|nr:galactokinase [Planctomycetaceae bacterium]
MKLFDTLLSETRSLFKKQFNTEPVWLASAPGRVNLIGEHTDYNDGFVFPMAIERQTIMAAAPYDGKTAKIYSAQSGELAEILIDGTSQPPASKEKVKWHSYVQGVVAFCIEAGLQPQPFCAVIHSNVPLGGGLSSSASLEVSIATVLEAMTGKRIDPVQKSLLCQQAEHKYAHMPCGIMDQFISALAKKDHAMLLDCRSQVPKPIPMSDTGVSVLIVNSNKKHELAGGEYAERRKQCEEAAQILEVSKLRDADPVRLETARDKLNDLQYRRAKHVISEDLRTRKAADALIAEDWAACGNLMYQSHFSMCTDFEITTPYLDLLVSLARWLGVEGGVYGSRMTGGGFGGCTVSLVKTDKVEEVSNKIREGYKAVTGIEPTIFATRPAQGAAVIEGS